MPRARQRGEVERQVQQAVHVEQVRLHGVEYVRQLARDARRPVRVGQRVHPPVVDDLDDCQSVVHAPGDFTVSARMIELCAQDGHVA